MSAPSRPDTGSDVLSVCHIVKGAPIEGPEIEYEGPDGVRFATPQLHLDDLTWTRQQPCPASEVPVREIIDVLHECGRAIAVNAGGHMSTALTRLSRISELPGPLLERMYADLPAHFGASRIVGTIEAELGGLDVLDGWRRVGGAGPTGAVRAYPPRLVHVLPGNAPVVAPLTVVRAAVTKGVSLLKLASNDLFTVPAILRTLAEVAPQHPVTRSFSAVYWRGGDARVESALFRSQFFDRLVAWGGEATIRGSVRYLGPGFELVSFDPKTSISMVGREAHASAERLQGAASATAADVTFFNQQACASSRIVYVEGTVEQVDMFCAALLPELAVERLTCTAVGPAVPTDLRDEISALAALEPEYRVWGSFDGSGTVVRSMEPVDFYPSHRVVNVVRVDSLSEALCWITAATQSVGVYPAERKVELADALAHCGVQMISTLGQPHESVTGMPHDGMFPLQRFVRWVGMR